MVDEFHEWLGHKLASFRVGRQHIKRAVHRKHAAQFCHLHELLDHAFAPESGQAVVPDRPQQLLHVRMGNKLESACTFVFDVF